MSLSVSVSLSPMVADVVDSSSSNGSYPRVIVSPVEEILLCGIISAIILLTILTYTLGRYMSVCEIASTREGVRRPKVQFLDFVIVMFGFNSLYLASLSIFISSIRVGVCLFGVAMNNDFGLV